MNRISLERRILIAKCVTEGCSLRSISRITDCDINTVMDFLRDLGDACAAHHDAVMRELDCKRIQCDEIWSYIHTKEDRVHPNLRGKKEFGDVYTWIALDPDTKLVPSFHVGKRTAADANQFIHDLASRVNGRIQLTSDGFKAYQPAIEDAFGSEIDYAQLHKIFRDSLHGISAADWLNKKRYAQPELDATRKLSLIGNSDMEQVGTAHIERFNLTVRMSLRRSARATNAFSKKFENFKAAMALFHTHYNFARIHRSTRVTPALEAGIADHVWSYEEIVGLLADPVAKRPKTYRKREEAA